jgi:hypothetical protein
MCRRFRRIYRLHFQGENNQQTENTLSIADDIFQVSISFVPPVYRIIGVVLVACLVRSGLWGGNCITQKSDNYV